LIGKSMNDGILVGVFRPPVDIERQGGVIIEYGLVGGEAGKGCGGYGGRNGWGDGNCRRRGRFKRGR